MSDASPIADVLTQTAKVGSKALLADWIGALEESKKLVAMIEAYVVPPIEPTSLDPVDRAEVDADVDAEVTKP